VFKTEVSVMRSGSCSVHTHLHSHIDNIPGSKSKTIYQITNVRFVSNGSKLSDLAATCCEWIV